MIELQIKEYHNVGKAKYVVSYYTGKKHDDGNDFYDVRIFSNKKYKDRFIGLLQAQYDIAKSYKTPTLADYDEEFQFHQT